MNGLQREAQERDLSDLQLLVDSIADYAIFTLDSDKRIRTWNRGAKKVLGYAADEILHKEFSLFFSADQRAVGHPETHLAKALEAGRFHREDWICAKGGKKIWAELTLSPLTDSSGKKRGGFGVVIRNLSERQGYEERYRLLVASVKDYAIFILDPEGYVQTWNDGAEIIKGYKPAEIIGRHFSTFYTQPDIDRQHPQEELRRAIETGKFEEEGWRVRKDGSQFWANVIITPVYKEDGTLIGFSKVTRDLTLRMQTEKALRESEEKFRLMVANVKDYAIIMLDPEGKIASWNAGAERITGWSEREILSSSFEKFYPPEDIAAGKTKMELEVAAREGRFEDHGWRLRKDGSRYWANVIITALRDESGRLRGFSKVTRDITERKNAEEALRKAYEELESFSYSVSHDLRAPLRSMDGFSEILLATLGEQVDEKSKGYLRRIRESAQRMAKLIDDLLNLSRVSRVPLKRQEVDLSEIARKVIEDLRKVDPDRKVEVTIPSSLKVYADPTLIRAALENLFSNAWKYTSKREIGRIEFGMERKHMVPVYFVRDNGAGFDMAYQEKLFGAFQRLHTEKDFAGTGIGLATVRRIVHRHGGDIWAQGQVDQGATFYFTL